jgi:hypothetical protein
MYSEAYLLEDSASRVSRVDDGLIVLAMGFCELLIRLLPSASE